MIIEVTEKQYNYFRVNLSGIVAHKEEGGKYFIKVMIKKYYSYIQQILIL